MLYENIKKRRKELKMTQAELAAKSGYTDKSMISMIEHGKVDIPGSKIELIAKALKTTSAELLGTVDEQLEHDLLEALKKLDTDAKYQAIEYIEFLASKEKQNP